jgi:HSP20 family protein
MLLCDSIEREERGEWLRATATLAIIGPIMNQSPQRPKAALEPEKKEGGHAMVFGYRTPHNSFQQLRDEMDRLLTGFFGPTADGLLPPMFRGQPAANLYERGDALLVEMEVPGVKHDQIDISVAGGELSVKVSRPEVEQEGVTYHRRERPVGSISRVLRLPVEVDADRVDAELRDGVLLITLPKAESARPRKINVAGG